MSPQTDAENSEPQAAPLHAPLEWDTPMYRLAVDQLDQLDQTAEQMNLDPNIWERLRTAALMQGIGRVKEAKHVRGVFP